MILGITYIKFSKCSEAALAYEEMNGQAIEGNPRPLKVMIAHRYCVLGFLTSCFLFK